MRVIIVKETMCIEVFQGNHVHWNSRENVKLHAFECAKVAMCIDLLSPIGIFWHVIDIFMLVEFGKSKFKLGAIQKLF
jgi:hypothetical protein